MCSWSCMYTGWKLAGCAWSVGSPHVRTPCFYGPCIRQESRHSVRFFLHLVCNLYFNHYMICRINAIFIKTPLANTGLYALMLSICSSVCLSVCLSVFVSSETCTQKCSFLKKLINLELWSLLTTSRKSWVGFSKNPFLDPWYDLEQQQTSPHDPQKPRTLPKTVSVLQ